MIEIPVLPPSINDTYKPGIRNNGKPYIYKTKEAKSWEAETQLLVRTKSAHLDWLKTFKFYKLRMDVWGARTDSDAYIKLAKDAVTRGLDFDDRFVLSDTTVKRFDGDWKGIIVVITGLTEGEINSL